MTALAQYARLEVPARYYDGRTAGAREVTVSFGARSLVILDAGGAALAHWPLDRLKAASAPGDPVAQLVPEAESDERLVLEDAEMIRAIEAVCPDLHRRPRDRRGTRRALVLGVAAIAAVAALVFVILPGLAERLAVLLPPEREQRLGEAVAGQVREVLAWADGTGASIPGYCLEPRGVAALDTLTGRLAATVETPYPLRVSVLDHPMVNAVALPGGRVILFRGLIEDAASPEEIAGILAHEIGHVVHRDPTVGVLRSAGTAGILGLMVGDVFGAAILVAASEAMLNARYKREVEARADETAYAILSDAGLPTAPFAGFFRRMAERHGATPEALQYFSSHPALADRARRAEAADGPDEGSFSPALEDTGWVALRGICDRTAESSRF